MSSMRAPNGVQIFSIGPVCAQGVVDTGLGTSMQPTRARLGALAMFVTSTLGASTSAFELGGVPITMTGRQVAVDGARPVTLTGRERQVLDRLLERPGIVHSKESLLHSIWGRNERDTHVVEVTVGRLRQRLGVAGVGIETVIRRGYPRVRTEPATVEIGSIGLDDFVRRTPPTRCCEASGPRRW